jgi:signal transduction histidine kinase
VKVERNLRPVPPVAGSGPQLQQVFLNLLLNAEQAIDGAGTIRVSTRQDGESVCVQFEDDGCGISEANCERIFDPFFTTKPVGEGTGLGLAISFQIVESHHGQITVDSELGVGTCFSVRLPIVDPSSECAIAS